MTIIQKDKKYMLKFPKGIDTVGQKMYLEKLSQSVKTDQFVTIDSRIKVYPVHYEEEVKDEPKKEEAKKEDTKVETPKEEAKPEVKVEQVPATPSAAPTTTETKVETVNAAPKPKEEVPAVFASNKNESSVKL